MVYFTMFPSSISSSQVYTLLKKKLMQLVLFTRLVFQTLQQESASAGFLYFALINVAVGVGVAVLNAKRSLNENKRIVSEKKVKNEERCEAL